MSSNVLPHTAPEQQGVSSSQILKFLEVVEEGEEELHSFMLLRNGYVVAEAWWSPYEASIPHMIFSLSKSFTSSAVGMAVNEGYFEVNDSVVSFFPDEAPAELTDYWAALRVKDLLSMSTGHDVKPFPFM